MSSCAGSSPQTLLLLLQPSAKGLTHRMTHGHRFNQNKTHLDQVRKSRGVIFYFNKNIIQDPCSEACTGVGDVEQNLPGPQIVKLSDDVVLK